MNSTKSDLQTPPNREGFFVSESPASAGQSGKKRFLVLPRFILGPMALLGVGVLPQLVLLYINLSAWDLVSGVADSSHVHAALAILTAEMLLLFLCLGACGWLWGRRALMNHWLGFGLLVVASAFLAVAFVYAERATPPELAAWMLPWQQWQYKQFALVMPIALLGALRFFSPDVSVGQPLEEALIKALGKIMAIGILGWMFLAVAPSDPFGLNLKSVPFPFVAILMATSITALVLRSFALMYVRVMAGGPGALATLTFFVAIVGPLLGLLLNAGIPFPVSFQSPLIYGLVLANGLVLMLPNFYGPHLHRAIWLLQCALFPFSLYFFVVFLPWVPLAPIAVLVFGMGLLMYTPILLFALHSYRILDGFCAEIRDGGKWVPLTLGVSAILIAPVIYTAQVVRDRQALHHALDYLYYPDYASAKGYAGDRSSLRSSLTHLRDFKKGLYLPYLSEYYNWIAFDGRVLPQAKLSGIYEAFFGEPLPEGVTSQFNDPFLIGRRQTVMEEMSPATGARPSTHGVIENVTSETSVTNGMARTRATVAVKNSSSEVTEFVTQIPVPPGVLISGLWLTIGGESVPGRLFEKRSATWVYQKITEVRPVPRDPAILRYLGPELAELRVYPVGSSEKRVVEVEFLYPQGLNPELKIGRWIVERPEAASEGILAEASGGGFSLSLPSDSASKLPQIKRRPYLHLLVDGSMNSKFTDAKILEESLGKVAKAFPGISDARLTFVNFKSIDINGSALTPLPDLQTWAARDIGKAGGRFQGGFLPYRAIKEVIWRHSQALKDGSDEAMLRFPRIVVLSGSSRKWLSDDETYLAEFSSLLPDFPAYWILDVDSGEFRKRSLGPSDFPPHSRAVRIFQWGRNRFVTPAEGPISHFGWGGAGVSPLEVYDPAQDRFEIVSEVKRLGSESAFGMAVQPWVTQLGNIFEPFKNQKDALIRLMAQSRTTGILVPSLAYIVVENSAQWKMLERSEKKMLKGHEAMDFAENTVVAPEPGTIGLIVVGVAVLLIINRVRRRQRTS